MGIIFNSQFTIFKQFAMIQFPILKFNHLEIGNCLPACRQAGKLKIEN
jgi:hypothetical protein